jgi:hypothetical protein
VRPPTKPKRTLDEIKLNKAKQYVNEEKLNELKSRDASKKLEDCVKTLKRLL